MTVQAGPLRVLVITEDDPLYVIRFFEAFFPRLPETIEIAAITVDRAFHEPLTATVKRMLRFYGPVDFVRQGLRFVATRVSGRSISKLADQAGIPLIETDSVNAPSYHEQVRALAPDVIVSVAAPQIFREKLLSIPPLGCVNIHSGRLPAYRGMMPVFWQMLAGESAVTVTVHEMVVELDMGRILGTLEFPLNERDSLHRVITATKTAGASLMIDVLERIREGKTEPREIDPSEAGYFSFPGPSDVRKFRRRGHRLL
jgi:methionyl-tRNA formyltransferase